MSSRLVARQYRLWQGAISRFNVGRLSRYHTGWIRAAAAMVVLGMAVALLPLFSQAETQIQALLIVALMASWVAGDRVVMRQAESNVDPTLPDGPTSHPAHPAWRVEPSVLRAYKDGPGAVLCPAGVSGCRVVDSLQTLLEAGVGFGPTADVPDIADKLTAQACELLDARAAWIHWFQDATGAPNLVSVSIRPSVDDEIDRMELVEGSRKLVEGVRLLAASKQAAGPWTPQPQADGSFMAVPLGCRGHIHGALTVFGAKLAVSEPQIGQQLLAALASQSIAAIDNALIRESQMELLAKMHQLRAHRADYVATVSHELRTPLTSIKGFAQLLMRADDMPAEVSYSYAKTIATEAEKLARIVNDIVDLTRMETGLLELNRRPVHIDVLVSSVLENLQPLALSRPVEVDIPLGLPAVRGDAEVLSQVLRRLVVDCVSHSMPDSILLLKADGGESGITIKLEYRPVSGGVDDLIHILGGIGQWSGDGQATQLGRGTLGLYIAKNYVEAHGGRLWVDSSEAQLARIAFTLPY